MSDNATGTPISDTSKLAVESNQIIDLMLHLRKMLPGNGIDGGTAILRPIGKPEKGAYLRYGKAKIARTPDEAQPHFVLNAIKSVIVRCSWRCRQETNTFIVSDCFYRRGSRFAEFADGEPSFGHLLTPQLLQGAYSACYEEVE